MDSRKTKNVPARTMKVVENEGEKARSSKVIKRLGLSNRVLKQGKLETIIDQASAHSAKPTIWRETLD
jgi:hypothetical protein